MKTSEILNRAADLIEQRGWVGREDQGPDSWGGGAGTNAPVCLEGGIIAALGVDLAAMSKSAQDEYLTDFAECPAHVAVCSYLETERAYYWNDIPGRTAGEVIEVLRATAVIEAAREEAAETVNQPTEELAVTW